MWVYLDKEISKEDFESIKAGEKTPRDFFNEAEICGYGVIAYKPYEKDGRYYIPYGTSTSCD